jgi:magnesium chelatase family protein
VRAAMASSALPWPRNRITVNLAPSGTRKGGSGLDLPIAIGVLVAEGGLPPACVEDTGCIGELGLDGSLRPVPGVVPMVAALECRHVLVPAGSHREARMVTGGEVHSAGTLRDLVDCLQGRRQWRTPPTTASRARPGPPPLDLADVRGQPVGRRALEVAAAGGHHLLLVGPPGSGKTMLASRLVGLLPPLGREEALEVTRIHSAAGLPVGDGEVLDRPPFRSPHHGATEVSLVGGGTSWLRPGEISLAHTGVSQCHSGPASLDDVR